MLRRHCNLEMFPRRSEAENEKMLPMPEKIVITYISRQSAHKRKLLEQDHAALVRELMALFERKNTEREAGGEKKVEVELVKDEREVVGELSKLSWQRRPLPSQSGSLYKSPKRNI